MTEDEMYDMMMECVKAAKANKIFQYYNILDDAWRDLAIPIISNIINNISMGTKYRVKPEPKTVRVRIFWYEESGIILEPRFLKNTDPLITWEEEAENYVGVGFHSWAGDEQILTVPEV